MALSPDYVKQIEDWLKWYNYHAQQKIGSGSVEKRLEFLEKGLRGAFVILAGLTYEVERVDLGQAAADRNRSERTGRIVLPVSFRG